MKAYCLFEQSGTFKNEFKRFGVKAEDYKDRSKNGDYYKKPTQYWFINFDPQINLSMQPLEVVEQLKISNPKMDGVKDRQVVRSMIHPQYARRFIYNYLLPKEVAKQFRG